MSPVPADSDDPSHTEVAENAAASGEIASDAYRQPADGHEDSSALDQVKAHVDGSGAQMRTVVPVPVAPHPERLFTSRDRGSATAADRSKTATERLSAAARRDGLARMRDRDAAARDRNAAGRDRAATTRDRALARLERSATEVGTLEEALALLRELRVAGAAFRGEAAMERLAAAEDRAGAAVDRKSAAADRRHSGMDELTGIFRRGRGELALEHELDRSRRSAGSMVLALIDVDRLKAVNDADGHAAGDTLLRDVAAAIISTMRSYDVTVRWGGDEFTCALSDMTLPVAAGRIAEIQAALAELHPGASISAGLAELEPDDTLESLIARADAALYLVKTDRAP